jgi:hypothetical protein
LIEHTFPKLNRIFSQHLNFTFSFDSSFESSYPDDDFGYMIPFEEFPLDLSDAFVFNIEPRTLIIPPGEVYGDYEKFLLPFDYESWVGIGVVFAATTVLILIIGRLPLKVQEEIVGRDNRSPMMNFISIFLNGGQDGTMIGNVPRILMMTFILWSLVIRSDCSNSLKVILNIRLI